MILNLFLLYLVGSRFYAQYKAEENFIAQTVQLLNEHQIRIDERVLQEEPLPLPRTSLPDDAAELAFFSAFLGEDCTMTSERSNVHLYRSSTGTAALYPSGYFLLECGDAAISEEDFESFFDTVGRAYYSPLFLDPIDGSTMRAAPFVHKSPVYNGPIECIFENGTLQSASGYFIAATETAAPVSDPISRCSAVVKLMDYCKENGQICNEISHISVGYFLQSTTTTPLLLTPVYRIETNTYNYYVDTSTGHITVIR